MSTLSAALRASDEPLFKMDIPSGYVAITHVIPGESVIQTWGMTKRIGNTTKEIEVNMLYDVGSGLVEFLANDASEGLYAMGFDQLQREHLRRASQSDAIKLLAGQRPSSLAISGVSRKDIRQSLTYDAYITIKTLRSEFFLRYVYAPSVDRIVLQLLVDGDVQTKIARMKDVKLPLAATKKINATARKLCRDMAP